MRAAKGGDMDYLSSPSPPDDGEERMAATAVAIFSAVVVTAALVAAAILVAVAILFGGSS
jgi:hypothetical protein